VKPLVFIAVIVCCCLPPKQILATGAVPDASGLEVSNASSVPVLIGDLTDDVTKLGLSKETIEARVNAVLRNNGLKPVEDTSVTDHNYTISVILVSGSSFLIEASFNRAVTYSDGISERHTHAMTWARLHTGGWNRSPTGHDEGAVDSILRKVSELTEQFANEFLKANQK
jgi:hypothetical protein